MRKDFVYLASASPRRRELLEQIGVPFEVRSAEIVESRLEGEQPEELVVRLARAKAERIWETVASAEERAVLGADTAVVLGETVLGKPKDREQALRMLGQLSGRTHQVMTGISVVGAGGSRDEISLSEVRFKATTEQERLAYVATGEPMDKAGSYAIQGMGAIFVEHLKGSYSSVVGLPLDLTASMLNDIGMPTWLHEVAE